MRLPEDKIKEAILHPDIEIRDRAVSYFGKSFSSDLTIMPLVIKAVETYGRENDAYRTDRGVQGFAAERRHHRLGH